VGASVPKSEQTFEGMSGGERKTRQQTGCRGFEVASSTVHSTLAASPTKSVMVEHFSLTGRVLMNFWRCCAQENACKIVKRKKYFAFCVPNVKKETPRGLWMKAETSTLQDCADFFVFMQVAVFFATCQFSAETLAISLGVDN
jgi:hypothetical protein